MRKLTCEEDCLGPELTIGAFRVRPQLNRLQSNQDGGTVTVEPRVMELLVFLAGRPQQVVSKDELIAAVWPDVAVSDDALKNAVWELRRALGDSARQPRYIETIPKRGYRLIAPVSTSGDSERTRRGGRRAAGLAAIFATVGVMVSLAGFLASDRNLDGSQGSSVRLAVLPFVTLGESAPGDYLGDGIAIDLITRLGRLEPSLLQVVAPQSALRSVEQGSAAAAGDAFAVGRKLDVDYVVQGSVRREDGRVRISAHLSRLEDGTQVWTQSYSRTLEGILDLQSEMAETIGSAIETRLKLKGDGRGPSVLSDAYQAYLLGNHHQFRAGDWDKAIEAFRRSVEIDPSFALGYASLSYAYFWGSLTPLEAIDRARQASAQALALDPELAEAHVSAALVKLYGDFDFEGADQSFSRALELDPSNVSALFNRSKSLAASGRLDEAIETARAARRLDPLAPLRSSQLGRLHYFKGEYQQAIQEYRKALRLDENSPGSHLALAQCYEALGSPQQAFEHRERFLRLSRWPSQLIGEMTALYGSQGYSAVLLRWMQVIEGQQRRRRNGTIHLAALALTTGDSEGALGWLQRALEEHALGLIYLDVSPEFEPLRGDPKFEAIREARGRRPATS